MNRNFVIGATCALLIGSAHLNSALAGQDRTLVVSAETIAFETDSAGAVVGSIAEQQSNPSYEESAGTGWLRAYATGPVPTHEPVLMADYYESEIEVSVREALSAALAAKGIVTSADDENAPFQISYSAAFKAAGKKGLPQSPLRLEPASGGDLDPSTFGRKTPETGFRPAIAIGGGSSRKVKASTLSVSVFVVQDGARVWSGFAEAELAGRSPRTLAQTLTGALMTHWGDNASIDNLRFVERTVPRTSE